MAFCDNKYCTKCKLHTKAVHPGLMGRGNKESGVLIIGDFPTKFEDEQGNVFLGKHGKFIQDRLDLVGLDPYFLYAIKCPIIGEKKSTTPAQRACCTPFTIKVIEEIKPKVIVTLGQVPMQQLLGMSYSTKVLRGKAFFFPELNAYVVPTYQPKGIIFESDSLLFTQFREDLELARSILSTPPKRKVVPQLKSLSDPISIKEYLLSLFQAEDVVLDLETNGLDSRESRITDISFSSRTNEGIHIKWEDLMEFYDIFKDFLASDIMKCFHNAAFDREMLYMAGFTNIKNIGYDTMLAFHTTNMSFEGKEQQGLYKLKTMAWFTSEHGGYESILEEEGGIAGIQGIKAKKEEKPKKLPYFWINEASKTFGEFRLKKDLSDLLKKDKECKEVQQEEFEAFKKEHVIPTVFNRLERKEPVVDWDYYNNLIRERRKARMEKTGLDKLPYYAAMDALVTREAMKYTKPEIDAQYKSIFYDHIMPLNYVLSRMRINGIRLDKEYMEGIKKENEKRAEECKQEFFKAVGKEINLGSSPQIQELLFKEMRIKPHPNYVSAVTKKPSANEEAILYYSEQYPELKLILDYRGIVKETSTYIDGFLSEIHPQTGRVHPSYLQNSTATGRLSCIAEGTKISCVGENKNIEDIKIGDLVYCYDDLGNKKTSKVKNVFDNGVRKCIELYIQDELGYEYKLICTPDHKIKTTYGWMSAENITNFNSIYFSGGLYTLKKVIKKAVNKLQVYDLEIEQYHNFIANEICVHNCIAPAMQTIPKDNRIRNMVVPTEGWRLVSADLSQAELRVLAQMSNDDAMIAAFLSGKDLHAVTACRAILGIDVDAFDKSIPEHKYARDISKCVHPDSYIIYNNKLVRIKNISKNIEEDSFVKVQDGIVFNGERQIKVKSTYKSIQDDRYRIVSKKGIIVCSGNHQIKLEDGTLKRAKDISKGDQIFFDQETFLPIVDELTYVRYNIFNGGHDHKAAVNIELHKDWAYIAGMFTGDGCYAQKHITIATGDGPEYEEWKDIIVDSFDKVGISAIKRTYRKFNDNSSRSANVYVGSTEVRRFFDLLGLTNSKGKTFRIPEWVLNNTDNCLAFLGGLIDTDGSVTLKGTTSVTTKSWELAQDITVLLNRLNLKYGIEECFNTTYQRIYYRVHIYSNSLKWISEKKVLRHPLKRERLIKRVSILADRNYPINNAVISNTIIDKGELLDLEVDSEDHLYWVNNFITHNTINFGIVYGMSSYTLAIRLGMPMNDEAQKRKSMQEAQMYIDKWFALYSGAKAWLDGIQEYCKRYGYVESLFGRRRYLHDIWSSDPSKAGGACRQAMNCVDEETEALTQRGWLKYNEISLEDILLTKNKDTGELEWQNVRALNIFPDYEGTIIEFNSKSFSAVTTPNHRWLIDSNYEGNTKIVTSDNLSVCGHHKIHRTGKYVKQSTMYSDDFIELVGWVLTDGHFKESTTYNNYGISIIQSNRAKPYNVKLIEDLLQRLDLKVYKQFDTVTECYNWSFWGEVPKKIKTLFPERKLNISFIKDISSTQAILLLETMLRGDGTVELPRGNQQGKRVFYTRHEDVAGVFQILCTMCGYSSNYRWRASYPKPYTSPKLRQPILNSKGVYVVNISWRSKAQVVPHQKKEYFDKKLMWCPSVDNTFFVARRNGTVYITGNSPIQSTASDITCTGLIRMQRFLDENPKYRSMIVGVIHDDILVDTPVEEVEDISKKLTECMTQDIPGIKLPLVADPSIHERWTKE